MYPSFIGKFLKIQIIGKEFLLLHPITEILLSIKKTEEIIRLSNIYNRSLIEASLYPLVAIGHDGKITDINLQQN